MPGSQSRSPATPGTAPVQDFLDMMLVNAFCPVRLIEIFDDIVAPNGTIAAMSSELGSITNNEGRWDLYASSKAALGLLMKCYTAHRPDDRRAKLIVAPGWIQTEMGGLDATFTVEECIPLVAVGDRPVDRAPASLSGLRCDRYFCALHMSLPGPSRHFGLMP